MHTVALFDVIAYIYAHRLTHEPFTQRILNVYNHD